MSVTLRRITETAIMLAVATVLSILQFTGPWALGGSITVCSMLPIIIIAHRYGTKWGLVTALTYSLLQLLLGIRNVQYAPTPISAIAIILLDYVLAFGVIGFAAVFDPLMKDKRAAAIVGIIVVLFGRLLFHIISGVVIWDAIYPNELGWNLWIWSIAYNGSYMVPEMLITSIVALAIYKPTEKFWHSPTAPLQA